LLRIGLVCLLGPKTEFKTNASNNIQQVAVKTVVISLRRRVIIVLSPGGAAVSSW
jgi:hypothetical protein